LAIAASGRSSSAQEHIIGGAATPNGLRGVTSVARTTPMLDKQVLALRAAGEQAQTMSEYAVILTVISATVILAVAVFATSIGAHILKAAELILP
jgi:Flp pilus assembly pilin Flp